jgi:hypothetical protein
MVVPPDELGEGSRGKQPPHPFSCRAAPSCPLPQGERAQTATTAANRYHFAGFRYGYLIIMPARENRLNMDAGSRLLRDKDRQEPEQHNGSVSSQGG